ncbi:hypothetical protein [Cryobacterium ruanii]|uniref:Uncharacterized protein n=1 Tax=Cryobacterium ruanii TaxID=1259197 RepID=A0A4R9AQH1_9MICO|nr:hypothetical protein [Cryobacterium ruanii]TFD67977.1 hypothetical protein E3T47_05130 [Cryobacterium ruanii]
MHQAVALQARWLADRIDRIAAPRDSALMELLVFVVTDVRSAVSGSLAAFPQEARASYSELPHPGCGGRVATFPPLRAGDAAAVQCERCEAVLDEVEWERSLVMAGAEATSPRGREAASIMRHLNRKLLNAAA